MRPTFLAVTSAIAACLGSAATCEADMQVGAEAAATSTLPVFFFHGATGNKSNGAQIQANLTAEGRTYVALDFCQYACSVRTSLSEQIQMAITQVREVIANDTENAYAKGYHFLSHSQGASIARGVIEEMDDHDVHTFISMAGDGNGNFYGPQASDQVPLQVLLQALGPYAIDASVFNFTTYEDDSTTWSGNFQRDYVELVTTDAELQAESSIANILLPPLSDAALSNWLEINTFLPVVNNLQDCAGDAMCLTNQARRKANFERLQAAHFFASPQDDVQAPWQACVLGKYSTVEGVDAVETKFDSLAIVDMKETVEYKNDLYGLQTLDTAGKLHIHVVADVPHNCWLFNYTSLATNVKCIFEPVYSANIYPLLT